MENMTSYKLVNNQSQQYLRKYTDKCLKEYQGSVFEAENQKTED